MNAGWLKDQLRDRLWAVADRHPFVASATLTGSFLDSPGLEGVGDIDFVVVVDHLDKSRFDTLVGECDPALRGVLAEHGYDFRVNPTLGPLKFNAPQLAVLHLMLYSRAAHVEHVLKSPFTCLDWQRSETWRKRSLADVYPVFGLQPRHFLGGRRGARDYLRDLLAGEVSYRELVCDEVGYTEEKLGNPMTDRDRHEFAYHVLRFLMQNTLKLLTRTNEALPAEKLTADYFAVFPDGADTFAPLLLTLAAKKRALDFAAPVPDLIPTLERFVAAFEDQFRDVFERTATRHVVFRHAPTGLNLGRGGETVFQGRGTDPDPLPIDPAALAPLAEAVAALRPTDAYTSPQKRAKLSMAALAEAVALPHAMADTRLAEIDYGAIEGLTVAEARAAFPDVFAAWARGEDPRLPGNGESTADVAERVAAFADECFTTGGDTVTCTHNVVTRCLVGAALGVPRPDWHRLRVPHLAPVAFVRTRRYGLYADLGEAVVRELFADWA